MKAWNLHSFNGIEHLEIEEMDLPEPEPGEVQIKMEAAGINPVDWKIADGLLKGRIDYLFPITLGWDVAGTITKVGPKVEEFTVGDKVFSFCRNDVIHRGSFAEYVNVLATSVAPKPNNLSMVEAASIPLSALTAYQALFARANLQKDEKVLIHAGAGGVGGFAIQLAKDLGAHVITTVRKRNYDYVKMLGADEIIDYTKDDFVKEVLNIYPEGVDVVFDTVGLQTLALSLNAVKRGGRLISIAAAIEKLPEHCTASFLFVEPNGKQLREIKQLIEKERIKPPRIESYPFEKLDKALFTLRKGHTQGKLVLLSPPIRL